MFKTLLIEPNPTCKRRGFSEKLVKPGSRHPLGLTETKSRLREVRDYSLNHLDAMVDKIIKCLSGNPDINVTLSKGAHHASEIINEISEGNPIAISKSAVVAKEILPSLLESGAHVIETYYDQFEPFDNQFTAMMKMPEEKFDFIAESFDQTKELISNRKKKIDKYVFKNFTGLLGVNAISADNGSIALLQHTNNISDVFEQAKELVLVVGLDKIVKNLEDAIFQTICMGIFGWETIPKSIHGKTKKEIKIDDIPFDVSSGQTTNKIHLIILDNGRSRILKSDYKDLIACIGCRACSKDCPTLPYFEADPPWSPKEYLNYHITGSNPSLELCLQCKSCKTNCPLDIDLPGMILQSRTEHAAMNQDVLTDKVLSNFETIAKLGHTMSTLTNVTLNNRLLRMLGENAMGISRERQLPKFLPMTFAKWFKSHREKS